MYCHPGDDPDVIKFDLGEWLDRPGHGETDTIRERQQFLYGV